MIVLGFIGLIVLFGLPLVGFAAAVGYVALENSPRGLRGLPRWAIALPLGFLLLAVMVVGNALILQPLIQASMDIVVVLVRSLLGL
jgi:hypothetical protein